MHDRDHLDQMLDRMLESSLSSYGDPGADSGLAERILSRVSNEQKVQRTAPGWRNRFLLWAALPAAACLLLTFVLLKSSERPAIHPSSHQSNVASVTPKSHAPDIANVVPEKKEHTRAVAQTTSRPAAAITGPATRPKLDVFPQPQPLSPGEQALYAFATQVPAEQRQAILAARRNDDAPLDIAAIQIQPLEITDTGKH